MREGEADFSQREVDATLALLIDTKAWIQRRTDRITLVDTYTIRRSITFEIELPEWTDRAVKETDCRLILPIGVFGGGQALRNLEVTFGQDPAGTLTRHGGDRLTKLLRERLQKNGDLGIPEGTRHFLDELLQLDSDDAGASGRGSYKKGNYVLFVTSDKELREASNAGSRFVITINTDQTLVRELGADKQSPSIKRALRAIGLGRVTTDDQAGGRRPGLVRRSFAKAWSVLFPSNLAFVLAQTFSGFGDARSWQLEIYAPEELRISDGVLIWWPDDGSPKAGESALASGEALPTRRARSMVALTRFRIQADSIIHIGQLVTYATIVLLAVAIGIALDGSGGPIVDAVVAVLVIAPSLGASIVTNPENHEMAGDFLKPLRARIYAVGAFAALAAALFIIFGLTPGTSDCEPIKERATLAEVEVGAFLDECQDTKASFWKGETQWNLQETLDSWSVAGKLAFLAMLLLFIFISQIGLSFEAIKRDINRRRKWSETILARGERPDKDLHQEVFLETTGDERSRRGPQGPYRSARSSRQEEGKPPLLTLSTDAIDLGPRAVFRVPLGSEGIASIDGYEKSDKGDQREAPCWERGEHRRDIPALFDRFFSGIWIQDRPPGWFFWSSDIEADYIRDDVIEWEPEDGDPVQGIEDGADDSTGEGGA
jgi:hypothetical protein